MRRSRRSGVAVPFGVVLAAVLTLGVAGCAGPEVIGEPYRGAGPGGVGSSPPDTGPAVGWVTEGERFFVTTYGSSSCPTAPTGIESGDRGPVVTMTRTGGNACTADFGPASYALDLPDRFGGDARVVVSLRFDDAPDVDLELPASPSP